MQQRTLILAMLTVMCAWPAGAVGATPQARTEGSTSLSPARLVQTVESGRTYETTAVFRNFTEDTFTAYVTVRDLQAARGEGFAELDTSGGARGARSWITPSVRKRELAPDEEMKIPLRINVPEDARPGVYTAGLVVSRIIANPSATSDAGARITVNASAVSQFVFTIPGELETTLRVRDLQAPRFVWPDDRAAFEARLENTGDTLVTASSKVGIGAFTGRSAQTLELPEVQLLPGGSRHLEVVWKDRPLVGWFRPALFVEGDVQLRRDYPVVFVLPPWWLVAALLAAIALPILVWLRNRRRRRTGR